MILLYTTKFRVNHIITRWDLAKRRFSIWRPDAILSLQTIGILLSNRSCKHNLRQHTKFRWSWMISRWDTAIKPFSKWRSSAILNFRNLIFWSCDLCYNVILLYPTKFRVNRIITRWNIAKDVFQYGGHPPYWICCDVIILHPGTLYYVPNIVLSFPLDWFSTFWYTWSFILAGYCLFRAKF